MKVYNRKLSAAEVTTNYTAAFVPGKGLTDGLVYELRIDEGQGSLLRERALEQHSTLSYGSWTYVPNPRLSQHGSTALTQTVFCQGGYRFGFNGQERDDEVSGAGNSLTAMYWQYDARLGRRWNVDPKPNASISMYATFANNPIWFSDPMGDTVTYNGLRERIDVTWARVRSKEFRAKFRQLKNDTRTWNFNSTIPEGLGLTGGGIGVFKDLRNGEEIPESEYTFNIYYNRDANANAPEYGLSRLHYLFEETYHVTEYLNGAYEAGINDRGFIGTKDKVNSEIDANVWAARNAPGGSLYGSNSGKIRNSRGAIAPPGSLRTRSYKSVILQNQNNREVLKVILFGSWTAHYRGKVRVKTGEKDPNGLDLTLIESFDHSKELPGIQK